MGTISGKINLAQLHHVVQTKKGKSGDVECLVIPIKANHLFKSEKGHVYLDLIAFDVKEPKDDTHIVKQSFPTEVREARTEEENKAQPILGNLNANFGGGSAEPQNAAPGVTMAEDDDLPF